MRVSRITGRGALAAGLVACSVATPAGAHIEREPIFVNPGADTSVLPAAGGDFVAARPLGDPARRPKALRRYARRAWRGGVDAREQAAIVRRFARLTKTQQSGAVRMLRSRRRAAGRGPTPAAMGLKDTRMQAERTLVVCQPDSMTRLRASLRDQKLSRLPKRDRRKKRALTALNRTFAKRCGFSEIQTAVNAADSGDTVVVMPGFYTEPTSRAKPHNDPACKDLLDEAGAATYAYHAKCPNDVQLIAVIGEDLEGRCVRCNVQISGSGARPEDVIVDGAKSPTDPGVSGDLFEEGRGLRGAVKEVGIRAERSDGIRLSNFTVQNFSEHGIYGIETDGMIVDRVNMFWAREYGHLTFVTDHNIVEDSEAAGSADAGLYPGASPPSRPRINTIVRRNYSHHNVLGFSGTMGSNIHIVDNKFVNNSAGISLDSFYRAGHPGFPQNSTVIERNVIAHNNFDTYGEDAWVKSSVQAPIGVGIFFAGGNDNVVKDNFIYDNWRWGTALISVPDALSNNFDRPPEAEDGKLSTSHRNRHEDNSMGIRPDGAKQPNGKDFWWDEMGQGNCWEDNPAAGGSVVSDPPRLPGCTDFPNVGAPNPVKTQYLAACAFAIDRGPGNATCDWFRVPPRPAER